MQRYVLTERGKLLIAMFIVFFIVLPSIVIVVWAVTREVIPNDPDQNDVDIASSEPDPETTNDISQDPTSSDGNATTPLDPSLEEPVDFNIDTQLKTIEIEPSVRFNNLRKVAVIL